MLKYEIELFYDILSTPKVYYQILFEDKKDKNFDVKFYPTILVSKQG